MRALPIALLLVHTRVYAVIHICTYNSAACELCAVYLRMYVLRIGVYSRVYAYEHDLVRTWHPLQQMKRSLVSLSSPWPVGALRCVCIIYVFCPVGHQSIAHCVNTFSKLRCYINFEIQLRLLNVSPQCPAFGVEILLHYVFPAFSTLFFYDLCFIHLPLSPLFPILFLSDGHGENKVDVTCDSVKKY